MKRILTIAAMAAVITPLLFAAEQQVKKATDFTLANYNGKKIKLSDNAGKIVVLEWFSYECPFARYNYEKTTAVNDLVKKFKDKNVVFLAINSTGHQEAAKNKEFAEQFKVSHPILNDSKGAVGKLYGAKTTPHMFVIDTAANIVYNGAFDNAPAGKVPDGTQYVNYVDKALTELIAGKAVSTPETKPYGCSVKYGK
jgi:peroxiredoxin